MAHMQTLPFTIQYNTILYFFTPLKNKITLLHYAKKITYMHLHIYPYTNANTYIYCIHIYMYMYTYILINYQIKWKKVKQARSYSNVNKKCNLCLWEKYFIICKPEMSTLNRRNEMTSTCRDSKKFLLSTAVT